MLKKLILSLFLILNLIALNVASADDSYDTIDNDDSYVTITTNEDNDLSYNFTLIKKINLKTFGIHSCAEVPLAFDRCIPSICLVEGNFGTVLAKIKGVTEKGCEYSERTDDIGGINCTFPNDELFDVNYLFNKRFAKVGELQKETLFSEEEVGKSEDLLTKYCTFVKDYNLTKVITINNNLNEEDNANDPEFSAKEIKKLVKETPPLSQSNNRFEEVQHEITLQNLKTLMFTPEEISLLNKIIEGFDTSEKDMRGNYSSYVKNGPGSYHLDSLFYYAPDKWSIWLNGIKYDNTSNDDSLKIETITANTATITWIVQNIDRISPDWEAKLTKISEKKYASRTNDIMLEMKGDKAYLYFKLKPNQTFDSRSMAIYDGKQR